MSAHLPRGAADGGPANLQPLARRPTQQRWRL